MIDWILTSWRPLLLLCSVVALVFFCWRRKPVHSAMSAAGLVASIWTRGIVNGFL